MSKERKKNFNENFFNEINNESKAYWLGFLYADGCVYDGKQHRIILRLQFRDHQQLADWHKAIESSNNIHYSDNCGYPCYCSLHYSRQMFSDLVRLGCPPRKSLIIEFPTENQVPISLISHFIRGYFDGDGSVYLTKCGNVETIRMKLIGTKNFLSKTQEILNLKQSLIKCPNTNEPIRYFNIGGNAQVKRLYNYLYKDATIFLKRKKDVFETFFSSYLLLKERSSSKYKWVHWAKNSSKWRSSFKANYKTIEVGFFDTELEAYNAAIQKRLQLGLPI